MASPFGSLRHAASFHGSCLSSGSLVRMRTESAARCGVGGLWVPWMCLQEEALDVFADQHPVQGAAIGEDPRRQMLFDLGPCDAPFLGAEPTELANREVAGAT